MLQIRKTEDGTRNGARAVSYTHLDVYKRQVSDDVTVNQLPSNRMTTLMVQLICVTIHNQQTHIRLRPIHCISKQLPGSDKFISKDESYPRTQWKCSPLTVLRKVLFFKLLTIGIHLKN